MKDKVIVSIIISVIVMTAALIWAGVRFSQRVDSCNEKNGILIKASQGYVCIKKDVIL